MGLFDSVFAFCPQCGHRLEFQSKAGVFVCQNTMATIQYTPEFSSPKDEHGHFLSGLGDWLLSGTDRHA